MNYDNLLFYVRTSFFAPCITCSSTFYKYMCNFTDIWNVTFRQCICRLIVTARHNFSILTWLTNLMNITHTETPIVFFAKLNIRKY